MLCSCAVFARRTRVDNDPEHDLYELDIDNLPTLNENLCATSGIEDLVRSFRGELEDAARNDPLQPFPTLYQATRSKFTRDLSYDLKLLFLAQIPSYDAIQTRLYSIRRLYVPATPATQAELNTDLDWFLFSREPRESIVKGDVLHSDGLL